MGIPRGFLNELPRIRNIIQYYEVHKELGAVNIDMLITEHLKIKIRYDPFHEDQWIQGFSLIDEENSAKSFIVVNDLKTIKTQRYAKAHELGHHILHPNELPLMCNPLYEDKIIEREANFFAAYVMVHPGALESIRKYGRSFEDLAESLVIPRFLVQKRYELYLYEIRNKSPHPAIFEGLDLF